MERLGRLAAGAALLVLLAPGAAGAAFITTPEAALDAIYGQGALDIDIRFEAPTSLLDPALLSIATALDLNALFAASPSASPGVNLFFVDSVDFCGGSFAVAIVGCANLPGNDIVVESAYAASLMGDELIAHELGHSLGLPHVSNPANLMNATLLGGTQLSATQMLSLAASPLVQSDVLGDFISITPILVVPEPVPEPGALGLLGAGLLGLAWGRAAPRRLRLRGRGSDPVARARASAP